MEEEGGIDTNQVMEENDHDKPIETLFLAKTDELYLLNPREPLWGWFEK